MPYYCYKCPSCGNTQEIHKPMSRCGDTEKCELCNIVMERDLRAEHSGTRHAPGNWPMESDAAGVAPEQVKEATEHARANGVPTDFTPQGAAVFTSARHRKEYCRLIGLHDRNGGFSDP